MAQTVCVIVTAEERVRLAAIVGDRRRPLKHVTGRSPGCESRSRIGKATPKIRNGTELVVEAMPGPARARSCFSGEAANRRQDAHPYWFPKRCCTRTRRRGRRTVNSVNWPGSLSTVI